MEENTVEKPNGKVYTERQIQVATFIGGPIATGYLFAHNYKLFGEEKKALYAWIIAILFFGILICIGFLLPDRPSSSNFITPIITTAIVTLIFKIDLDSLVENHIANNGDQYNWGRPVVVGIISLISVLAIAFGVYFLTEDEMVETPYKLKTYGVLKHEIYYDEQNISEEELDKLAFALTRTEYFDNQQQASVFAKKENNKIVMDLVIINTNLEEEDFEYVKWLKKEVQFIIRPYGFKINLMDNNGKVFKSID